MDVTESNEFSYIEPYQRFTFNEPYRRVESAAKKMKTLWMKNRPSKLRLEMITENRPLFTHHTGLNWLDIKRKQDELRMCRAVFLNNLERVHVFLMTGINPNCYDCQSRTPLHLASSKGFTEMVKLLLDNGADPNLLDCLGNIPLHLAACTNNVEVVLLLLKGGTNVNTIDIRGRSPLQLAQSKLKILQQSHDTEVKKKISEIIDMLRLFLKKKKADISTESELLESFQNRLQISETEEEVNTEIDNLSKMLTQLQFSVSNKEKA